MTTPSTIRVVIPLAIRKRNGRPRILPPDDVEAAEGQGQDPRTLRALARAWYWRRRLERGEAATLKDIADAERVTDRFVGRMLHLAYLSPAVLEQLTLRRRPSALSLKDLADATRLPWCDQEKAVFGE